MMCSATTRADRRPAPITTIVRDIQRSTLLEVNPVTSTRREKENVATPQTRKKWFNTDHSRLLAVFNSIADLLTRNAVLTSQGNPMLQYDEIQILANAQAIANRHLLQTTSL